MRLPTVLTMSILAAAFWVGAPLSAAAGEGVSVKEYSGGKRATLGGRSSGTKKKPTGRDSGGRPETRSPSEGGDPDKWYEPGEVIVLDPPKGFSAFASSKGFRVLERERMGSLGMELWRLKTPKDMAVPQALRVLKGRFPGLTVDANHLFDASAGKSGRLTARGILGWPEAPPSCGKGLKLGMIDAPVDASHPALKGQRVTYRSFHNPKRRPAKGDHGTAVAAMLVGKPGWGGLLPGATLKAANMFEINEGGKKVGSAKGLLSSVDWLIQQKVDTVNLSVAGADNKVVRLAFNKARQKGLVMVAAAGNWGRDDKPAFPAAYKHVMAVTAVDDKKRIYRQANQGSYIEFAAPGVDIWTAVPGGGRYQSGTSFATPYLTAITALAIKKGVAKRTDSLRSILRKYAVDLGKGGRDTVYGWGFLNMKAFCAKKKK